MKTAATTAEVRMMAPPATALVRIAEKGVAMAMTAAMVRVRTIATAVATRLRWRPTKRAMARVTSGSNGNKEGKGKDGKRDGTGNKEGKGKGGKMDGDSG
jgi:hypothetical protein